MGLRIGTNIASIAAQRELARSEKRTTHALNALSSGSRIVSAGDDAAGFAVSETLRGQAASLVAAKNNAENAQGMIQVAEGGLNEQNNILIRLRELTVQSASDTVSETERQYLNIEFNQLSQELDRIAKTTLFGSKPLLQGQNQQYQFHLGTQNKAEDVITFNMDADTRGGTLGIASLSISDRDEARGNLQAIDSAVDKIAGARAKFGAIQSRLEIATRNVDQQRENVLAAKSRISDADVAYETSELVAGQLAQDIGISVLAQANQNPLRALKLI